MEGLNDILGSDKHMTLMTCTFLPSVSLSRSSSSSDIVQYLVVWWSGHWVSHCQAECHDVQQLIKYLTAIQFCKTSRPAVQYNTVQYSTVHFIWQDEVQQSPIDGDAEHVILKVESRSLTALQLSVIFKSELDKNHYRYISLVI